MLEAYPKPKHGFVLTAQALLGVLFIVGVVAILLLPKVADDLATDLPEYADLRNPLLVIAIAVVTLALIALATIALLVQRIYNGRILHPSSLVRVDIVTLSLLVAAALDVAGFVVISNGQAGSPFLALIQIAVLLGLITLACITLILRSLLRNAIAMRAELDEVV